MFGVTVLHVLGQGGVLRSAAGWQYSLAWFLETGAYCAVNCFALISGFVGYRREFRSHKWSKYMELWMQVVFWCLMVTGVFYVCRPETVGIKQWIKACFPVTFSQYWYFTAYTGVFLVAPWLDLAVWKFEKKEMLGLLTVFFLAFSLYTMASQCVGSDIFALKGGYSFLWLAALYLLGACVRVYEIGRKISTGKLTGIVLLFWLLTWLWKIGFGKLTAALLGRSILDDLLVSYLSPTVLGMAAALLLLFQRLRLSEGMKKWVTACAPMAFGVYIIHCHPLFFEYLVKDLFTWAANISVWLLPMAVLGGALLIFAVCMLLEWLRILFFRCCKLRHFTEKAEETLLQRLKF